MRRDVIDGYKLAKRAHDALYRLAQQARPDVTGMQQEALADLAYGLSETVKYLDDARKELQRLQDLAEKVACARWATDSDGGAIKTPHVTAVPSVKMSAKIPRRDKDPEKYAALMVALGIPAEIVHADIEVVRPHWPGFVAHVSSLAERGLPLPDGVDPASTYPIYSLTLRGQKEVAAE